MLLAACNNSPKETVVTSEDTVTILEQEIFDDVQKTTFQYFWDGAEPNSGLARERYHMDGIYPDNDKHIITSGGGGFGVLAILVGMERGFITRAQGIERFQRILDFLEKADRFHGAYPHWWDGETGKVKPFSKHDNGGDLVETAYMIQALLCVRQYFANGTELERSLAARCDALWREVEFDWYRNGENVLYWHWSPEYGWKMNNKIAGYNECLITYVLAASSPTHPIPAEVYHEGWAKNGKIKGGTNQFGFSLQLNHDGANEYGGPLFWAHYSYLALDPRNLKDQYADYWQENKNQTLINYNWCVNNPKKYKGYGADNWGLTASYSIKGYAAHAPGMTHDLGVISPAAALGSMPFTPKRINGGNEKLVSQ
ncbi:MAG: beta-glucosidase [Chitinophagaceae bacterium]|nr:beta-glucosidase [Chitinophagaceae bacterium]